MSTINPNPRGERQRIIMDRSNTISIPIQSTIENTSIRSRIRSFGADPTTSRNKNHALNKRKFTFKMMKETLLNKILMYALLFFSFSIGGDGLRTDDFPFSLGVRDSLMIAHSFHGHPSFGPAGGMHGATYTCDVDFLSKELHPETNWVIDIGKALDILSKVLSRYNLKNLDEVFPDKTMTTTEFMCKQIHDDIRQLLESECADFKGVVRIKLWESHKAWATYTGPSASSGDNEPSEL